MLFLRFCHELARSQKGPIGRSVEGTHGRGRTKTRLRRNPHPLGPSRARRMSKTGRRETARMPFGCMKTALPMAKRSDCRRAIQTIAIFAGGFYSPCRPSAQAGGFAPLGSAPRSRAHQIGPGYAKAFRNRLTTRSCPSATIVSKSGGATACPTIATRVALISKPAFTPAAAATAREARSQAS